MEPFPRVAGRLCAGARLDLEALADVHGTPLYVYSGDRMLERLAAVRDAFAGARTLVAYSVKANPCLAILRLLARAGAGADIVSGGELHAALLAGIPAERIVFAGVGKTRPEMRMALEAGIRGFHVESAQELDALAEVAEAMRRAAPVAVRVNPDVESPTHEFTRTGHARAKFGVPPAEAVALYRRTARHPWLRAVGIDVHIGSQLRRAGPFLRALDVVLDVAEAARRDSGARIEYVDLGGGFGIGGPAAPDLDVDALGRRVAQRLGSRANGRPPPELVVEPGRFLVGDAGVLITRVLYVKRGGPATFVVVDAGMTELIRPSHYGGEHDVVAVREPPPDAEKALVDIVGPVCEQGDFLARGRAMPLPEPGSLLCIKQAGAYGLAMASNYNSRPRPAEVLVLGDRAFEVRRRESYEDLISHQAPVAAEP